MAESNIPKKTVEPVLKRTLDGKTFTFTLTPTASGTLTIETANTVINYNDATKTKTHTLTFRATSEASFITNQEINIDVEFRQDV